MAERLFVLDTEMTQLADKIREKTNSTESLSFPQGFINAIDNAAGLNFAVVGGTTQPSNPKENTIWVNTNVEITDWIISLTQPISPENGEVWIVTQNNKHTELNVLNNKTLNIYPHSCYQYIDGAWVLKTAQTYRNGVWSPWILYAYKRGDLCQDVSGGWRKVQGTVTFNSDSMYFKGSSTRALAQNNQPIDLTGFNSMVIIGYANSSHSSSIAFQSCYLTSSISGSSAASWGQNGVTNFTKTIDISSLQGSYTIYIGTGEASGCNGYIYEIYFV